MRQAIKELIISLLQRKVIYLIYSIVEKWILLISFASILTLSNNLLIFIIVRDLLAIILFGIVTFDKVKTNITIGKAYDN